MAQEDLLLHIQKLRLVLAHRVMVQALPHAMIAVIMDINAVLIVTIWVVCAVVDVMEQVA